MVTLLVGIIIIVVFFHGYQYIFLLINLVIAACHDFLTHLYHFGSKVLSNDYSRSTSSFFVT